MPRDGSPQPELSETVKAGWRDMGRHAARNGMNLRLILTNNPLLDACIREGYAMIKGGHAEPMKPPRKTPQTKIEPFSVDLFGEAVTPVKGRR